VAKNIHPVFERTISGAERSAQMGQEGRVIWFTGLSGSGKTTIALSLERYWFDQGYQTFLLDGDNIRSGINKDLGFSNEDRRENIRRIAEVARLMKEAGLWVLCSFVSPTREIRALARDIIGEGFHEIWVSTPLEECEDRDVKGLYAKARAGEIPDFTGISAPFEAPDGDHIEINTLGRSVEDCVRDLLGHLGGIEKKHE
jgi:adenylyl-sulfate kinase